MLAGRTPPYTEAVIPALGAGIHALGVAPKAWIPGPSPGMTTEGEASTQLTRQKS